MHDFQHSFCVFLTEKGQIPNLIQKSLLTNQQIEKDSSGIIYRAFSHKSSPSIHEDSLFLELIDHLETIKIM